MNLRAYLVIWKTFGVELVASHLMFAVSFMLTALMGLMVGFGFPALHAGIYLGLIIGLLVIQLLLSAAIVVVTGAEQKDCDFCGSHQTTTVGQINTILFNFLLVAVAFSIGICRVLAAYIGS